MSRPLFVVVAVAILGLSCGNAHEPPDSSTPPPGSSADAACTVAGFGQSWSYEVPPGRHPLFFGVADQDGNTYLVECATCVDSTGTEFCNPAATIPPESCGACNDDEGWVCEIASLDASGAVRFRHTMPTMPHGTIECGSILPRAQAIVGDWLVTATNGAIEIVDRRDGSAVLSEQPGCVLVGRTGAAVPVQPQAALEPPRVRGTGPRDRSRGVVGEGRLLRARSPQPLSIEGHLRLRRAAKSQPAGFLGSRRAAAGCFSASAARWRSSAPPARRAPPRSAEATSG